jgi:hypothetical protein
MSIAERLRAIADEVAALEAPPPPPPPPPPPEPIPEIHAEPLNQSRVVLFELQSTKDRYQRFQNAIVMGETWTGKVLCVDYASGGAARVFAKQSYPVLANGKLAGTFVPLIGAVNGKVTLDLSAVPDGNVAITIDVTPPPDTLDLARESNPTWWVIKGAGDPNLVPAAFYSYQWSKGGKGHKWALMPRRFTPTPRPLKPVQHAPLVVGTSSANLHLTQVAINRGTLWRPNVLEGGQWSTANIQPYFYSHFNDKDPGVHLLDGPRGVGTVVMPSDILVGRDGSAYFSDGWRIAHVSLDGTVTTKAGRRHKHPPSYRSGPQDMELVGDWSAISDAGGVIGTHETWRIRWRPKSIKVDETAPPVLNDRTGVLEHPHPVGPQLLVTDTQNNRVLVNTADPRSHATPWKVTLLADNLMQPWGLAIDEDDMVYVTEQTGNRIVKFPFDKPNERTLVAVVARPQGLDLQGDWLYFGSLSEKRVGRIHRHTHEMQTLFTPKLDNNSHFVQLSLGPDGTIYVVTWGLFYHGRPEAWIPQADGTYTRWLPGGSGDLPNGRGGKWSGWGYPSAVAVSADRIYFGGSQEGLGMIRMALPNDPTHDVAAFNASQEAWQDDGQALVHGTGGYGFAGLPLPADEKYAAYLAVNAEGT